MAGRNAPPEQTLAVFMPDLVVGGKVPDDAHRSHIVHHSDEVLTDLVGGRQAGRGTGAHRGGGLRHPAPGPALFAIFYSPYACDALGTLWSHCRGGIKSE